MFDRQARLLRHVEDILVSHPVTPSDLTDTQRVELEAEAARQGLTVEATLILARAATLDAIGAERRAAALAAEVRATAR